MGGHHSSPSDPTNCPPGQFGWAGGCWTPTSLPTEQFIKDYIKRNASIGGDTYADLGCKADSGDNSLCYQMAELINKEIDKVNDEIGNCTFNTGYISAFRCYADNPGRIFANMPWWVYVIGGLYVYEKIFK